jgi:hypothetical protein
VNVSKVYVIIKGKIYWLKKYGSFERREHGTREREGRRRRERKKGAWNKGEEKRQGFISVFESCLLFCLRGWPRGTRRERTTTIERKKKRQRDEEERSVVMVWEFAVTNSAIRWFEELLGNWA